MIRLCRLSSAIALLVAFLSFVASPEQAGAQPVQPVGRFVVDARGAVPFLPHDDILAVARDTTSDLMPTYGWGFEVGAHVYPFRWKVMTFGIGASYLLTRGSRTPPALEDADEPSGPTVTTRFRAFSPQVSFNFGHRMGWSYLSGGIGRSTLRAWRDDLVEDAGAAAKTINYGGGARWFINPHVAFGLDLRFYAINSVEPVGKVLGHPRMTFAVASAGMSIR